MDVAKKIYERMIDDISGQIFLMRLNYSITDEDVYIERLLDLSIRKEMVWSDFCTKMRSLDDRKTVLFGSGIWGGFLLNELKDIRFKAIIDNSTEPKQRDDIPVINAKGFFSHYSGEKIIISSYKNRESMISQCMSSGVKQADIIDASSIMYELTEGKIYFDKDIPLYMNGGLFIDGGCFDGTDTARFIDNYKGEAICFEPDVKNIEKIENKLKDYSQDRFRIIPKGLWSESGTVSFSAEGACGSRIKSSQAGNDTVETITIDEAVSDKKVSMIKMDIEGAETDALKGSKCVIRRDHPILAISIYHKPEDIIEIPDAILSISDKYKFYLRHYSFSWYDTVLYAIPQEMI